MLPLKFCRHRWAENIAVAKRALLVWPNIKKYMEEIKKKKEKRAQNLQSFKNLNELQKLETLIPQVILVMSDVYYYIFIIICY